MFLKKEAHKIVNYFSPSSKQEWLDVIHRDGVHIRSFVIFLQNCAKEIFPKKCMEDNEILLKLVKNKIFNDFSVSFMSAELKKKYSHEEDLNKSIKSPRVHGELWSL